MTRLTSERGAILVHTAFALLALMLFTGFVVDYGTFLVSRNQVQNSADAAALAGAQARIFDDTTDPPASSTNGKVHDIAASAAAWNRVWGSSPTITLDWTCPDDGSTNCVAARAYRDGSNASTALPTFFLELAGITSQRTMGYAVAKIETANSTTCLKPWEIPDRWIEKSSPANTTYEPGTDIYRPPSDDNPTGYTTADVGTHLTLRLGDTSTPSYYQRADLDSSGDVGYRDNILDCAGGTWSIGESLAPENGVGSIPQQNKKMADLFLEDARAQFDTTTGTVIHSCADDGSCTCGMCANGMAGKISPLIVLVSVVDPFAATQSGKSKATTPILNFLPIFITAADYDTGNGSIGGYIVKAPGMKLGSGGGLDPAAGFLQTVQLIR